MRTAASTAGSGRTAFGGHVLALLPEEPAGKICTANAGAISFSATLAWRPGEGIPTGIPAGPILGAPAFGARFYSLRRTDDDATATRRISFEIRALCAGRLAGALDGALRSVTACATLTEAVLETCVVRLADPSVAPAALVEELARQLWDAGFPVSFGLSWTPAPGAGVSVGIRGLEEPFEAFLRTRPAWDHDEVVR